MSNERSIGAISISVVAKTDKFNKGLDQVTGKLGAVSGRLQGFTGNLGSFGSAIQAQVDKLGSFVENIKGLGKAVGGLKSTSGAGSTAMLALGTATTAVVAAAVAAAVALGGLAAAQAPAIDANAKLAARIGTTYDNLIALQHAASLGGVETNALNDSLQKLGVKLNEASKGAGPVYDALQKLGLNARDLSKKDRVKAYADIATAIDKIKNPAEKAAAATALFEEQGPKMVGFFKDLTGNLALSAAEMKKFGLSLSQADTKKVEDMNDAFTRVKASFAGIGTQVLVAVAPAVEQFANLLTNVNVLAASIIPKISDVASALWMVVSPVTQANKAFKALGLDANQALKSVKEETQAISFKGEIDSLTQKYKDQIKFIGKTAAEVEILRLKMRGASDAELMLATNAVFAFDALTKLKQLQEGNMTEAERLQHETDKIDEQKDRARRRRQNGRLVAPEQLKQLEDIRKAMAKASGKSDIESVLTGREKYEKRNREIEDKLRLGAYGEGKAGVGFANRLKKLNFKEYMAPITDVLDTPFEKLNKQLDSLKDRFRDLTRGEIKQFTKELAMAQLGISEDPREKLKRETDSILDAFNSGKIDAKTAERGIYEKRQSALGSTQLSGADEYGSAAAVSAENRAKFSQNDPILQVNLRQEAELRRIANAVEARAREGQGVPEDEKRG